MKLEIDYETDPISAARQVALKLGVCKTSEDARVWNRTLGKIDDLWQEYIYASYKDLKAPEKAGLLRKVAHLENVRRALGDLYYADDLATADVVLEDRPAPPVSEEAPPTTAEPSASNPDRAAPRTEEQILQMIREAQHRANNDVAQMIHHCTKGGASLANAYAAVLAHVLGKVYLDEIVNDERSKSMQDRHHSSTMSLGQSLMKLIDKTKGSLKLVKQKFGEIDQRLDAIDAKK